MKKSKIFIVSAFCGPLDGVKNNRFVYFASYFSDKFDVELLTTNFYHSKKEVINNPYDYSDFKLTVFRVPRYSSNISLVRLWSHFIFATRVFRYLNAKSRANDIIYCSFPPITLSLLAFAASKNKSKFFLDIQDLWPEVFYSTKKFRFLKPFFFIHGLAVKWLARRVSSIIAVSETYLNHFKSRGFKGANEAVVYIGVDSNLVPTEAEKPPKRDGLDKKPKVKFIYAGTLGHSYNLAEFIKCFSEAEQSLNEKIELELTILGSGPLENDLKGLARSLNCNVLFMGRLSYMEVLEYLRNADVAVNSVASGMQQSIINKHGDYTIMGLPILNTQDNPEFKALVASYGVGLNANPGSNREIVDAIIKLSDEPELRNQMAQNSKKLGQERFNRANSYNRIKDLLLDTV